MKIGISKICTAYFHELYRLSISISANTIHRNKFSFFTLKYTRYLSVNTSFFVLEYFVFCPRLLFFDLPKTRSSLGNQLGDKQIREAKAQNRLHSSGPIGASQVLMAKLTIVFLFKSISIMTTPWKIKSICVTFLQH